MMRSLSSSLLLALCVGAASCAHRGTPPTTRPAETVIEHTGQRQQSSSTHAPDVRPADTEGLSALHQAAQRGDAEEVRRLLANGADANARGPLGQTPLLLAMNGAWLDAMHRSMAPPDQRGHWSQAQARARERQTRGQPDPRRGPMQFVEVTKLLLAHGADPSAAGRNGAAPIHVAAETGNAQLVSLLIRAKVDVNALDHRRGMVARTPIVAAAASGDLEVVRVLLDAGADPAKVPENAQGYFVNIAMSDIDVFRLLLDRGMKLPPGALAIATRNGHAEAAAEIIRRGKPGDAGAALFAAVTSSHDPLSADKEAKVVDVVRMLLDAGASPSAPDGTGEALLAAVANGQSKVAQLLRDRGAKIDWTRLKDQAHQPFKIAYDAALEDRVDRLREFESLGMPLDALGASILGRADRLRAVIAAGKEPVAGEAGSTALYFAARYGHVDCARLLLDAKTDVNARVPSWDTPNTGPRPLGGAAVAGHADMVRLLLDRGAKPTLLELDDDERVKLSPEIRKLLWPNETR